MSPGMHGCDEIGDTGVVDPRLILLGTDPQVTRHHLRSELLGQEDRGHRPPQPRSRILVPG
jgi:hypothetical protein